jgi:DHA1 family multidrug resistance protein-like MFS transporter
VDKRILGTILLSLFIALLGMGIIAPIIPIYATHMGATGISLGVMVAGFSISRGVLQPFVGGLSDRQGRKRFLVAGLFIYALSGFTYTLATSMGHLILVRLFHGIGSAMVVPIAMGYVGELAPRGQEGRYMGMLNIALFAGIGGGPVIGGLFLDAMGMNWPFYAMAAMSGISLLLVLAFLPPRRAERKAWTGPSLFGVFLQMMGSTRVMGILLSRMSTMIILIPSMAFLPVLMSRFMEATGVQIGMVVASRTLVNALLQVPFGRMVDRFSKVALLVIGALIISSTLFMVPLADSFIHLIGLFTFAGIGEAIVWPCLGALAAEEGRHYGQGSIMGVFSMAMSAGVLLGSIGSGAVMDLLGLSYAFYVVSVFLVFATAAAAVMIRGGQNVRRPIVNG